eukprot:1917527-Alexandrium_andersonii.AAC.1
MVHPARQFERPQILRQVSRPGNRTTWKSYFQGRRFGPDPGGARKVDLEVDLFTSEVAVSTSEVDVSTPK